MAKEKPWWEKPQPEWVIKALGQQKIEEICSMKTGELVEYHNKLTDEGFGDEVHTAKIWVAQGECWRRGLEATSVSATPRKRGK